MRLLLSCRVKLLNILGGIRDSSNYFLSLGERLSHLSRAHGVIFQLFLDTQYGLSERRLR